MLTVRFYLGLIFWLLLLPPRCPCLLQRAQARTMLNLTRNGNIATQQKTFTANGHLHGTSEPLASRLPIVFLLAALTMLLI